MLRMNQELNRYSWQGLCGLLLSMFVVTMPLHANESDIAVTKHNLSASGPGTVKAVSESQICVFCHTPHGATLAPNAPLWNRELSTATYTLYTSDSMDATLEQPGGSSKLCLSCHDGALAIGSVNFANGVLGATIDMAGVDPDGSMPSEGAEGGFTRNLGTNLSNDHPISFTYDSNLAGLDGELHDPVSAAHIGNRVPGMSKPAIPLENDQVQCISCHDPHITDEKFLRLNRQQKTTHPTDGHFDISQDIVCLGCHDKTGWGMSAHSHSEVASEVYTDSAADLREFPRGIQVWQASCLNCHDPHTVQGARMLLREGTDGVGTPKSGGSAAQEETCYQCHDVTGGLNNILAGTNNQVPDIKSEFALPYSKPITNAQQGVTQEAHSILDHDMLESAANLGQNRHAECTDCHNPHRIIRNQLFNANPASPDAVAHHNHNIVSGEIHSNIISGALAGSWGVEPIYGNTAFGALPTGYEVKKGYAGPGASTAVESSYVTREYQICLKCHSSYAYGENPPTSGPSIGINSVTQYTDQAMEFQAPAADMGEPGGNHRSWHPVINSTGRTAAVRGMDHTNFLAPWNDNNATTRVGQQTMYCSDCHGSNTAVGTVDPEGSPWGPHGSDNPFLLKGTWDNETGTTGTQDSGICFKCHDWNEYANRNNNNPKLSGFRAPTNTMQCALNFDTINLHVGHAERIGADLECTWCHAAVPHGWKNKALLIDITTDSPTCNGVEPCTDAPYILEGYLGGGGAVTWKASGQWTSGDCGGRAWMNTTCNAPQ